MDEYKVVKKAKVDEVGTGFKGIQFCILRGSGDVTIQKLRDIVESFGGTCVANPSKSVVGLRKSLPAQLV